MKIEDVEKLKKIARLIRADIIKEVYSAKSGHPGGALSIVDILTVLYFNQMNISPEDPRNENRDRFVLSKGHASAALYATLAERGFFSVNELENFRKLGSMLQGHPDMKHIPGVDMTTGSLGQGLSVANGMAMMSKLDKKGIRVYTILGDGEIEEGQIWEAAMTTSQYRLDNLCVIVDNNNLQIDGELKKVMSSYPIDKKFESFGFVVFNVDGNDIEEIIKVCESAKVIKGKPVTIKGKGVSFMEGKAEWHGKAPSEEEFKQAIKELGAQNL